MGEGTRGKGVLGRWNCMSRHTSEKAQRMQNCLQLTAPSRKEKEMKKDGLGQIVGKLGTEGYKVWHHYMIVKSKHHMVSSLNMHQAILVQVNTFISTYGSDLSQSVTFYKQQKNRQ